MKITRRQLRQIIKEELSRTLLNEMDFIGQLLGDDEDVYSLPHGTVVSVKWEDGHEHGATIESFKDGKYQVKWFSDEGFDWVPAEDVRKKTGPEQTQMPSGGGSFSKKLSQFDKTRNNWRSSQPSARHLRWLLKDKGIKRVIRVNGNEGRLTMKDEEKICKELGVEYNMGKSGYVNAHADYVKGQGYVGSIEEVLPELAKGDCFIHCRAGADRTGYLVAAYKKKYQGVTNLEELWKYTIGFNNWGGKGGYICRGIRGYIKYLEGFYPFEEWCTNPEGQSPSDRLTSCRSCRKFR